MASETQYPAFVQQRVNGTIAWQDPSNIFADDNSYAKAPSLLNGFVSNDLLAADFGFSIPGGATIDGVEVEVGKFASDNGGIRYVTDSICQIAALGTLGTNKGDTITKWGLTEVAATYGGPADTWSIPSFLTPVSINASSFTVLFGATIYGEGSTNVVADVDYIKVTTTYTITGGGGSTAGAFLLGLINPRKHISFPGLWTPRPRERFAYCQRRIPAILRLAP